MPTEVTTEMTTEVTTEVTTDMNADILGDGGGLGDGCGLDAAPPLTTEETQMLLLSKAMIEHANLLQAESLVIQRRLDTHLMRAFPAEMRRLAEIGAEHQVVLSQGRLLHLSVLGSVDDRVGGNEITEDLLYGLDWKTA